MIGYAVLEAGELDDATQAIGLWCETHDWPLAKMVHDTVSARSNQRPGLAYAMEEIRAGGAAGLVVARLRDLADSVTELGPLLRWFTDGTLRDRARLRARYLERAGRIRRGCARCDQRLGTQPRRGAHPRGPPAARRGAAVPGTTRS